jgi:hypothetical protein
LVAFLALAVAGVGHLPAAPAQTADSILASKKAAQRPGPFADKLDQVEGVKEDVLVLAAVAQWVDGTPAA